MWVWPPPSLSVNRIPQCLVCVWNILADPEALLKTHTRSSVWPLAAGVVGGCVSVVRLQLSTQVRNSEGFSAKGTWEGVDSLSRMLARSLCQGRAEWTRKGEAGFMRASSKTPQTCFCQLASRKNSSHSTGYSHCKQFRDSEERAQCKTGSEFLQVSSFWFPYERPEAPWSVVDMILARHS